MIIRPARARVFIALALGFGIAGCGSISGPRSSSSTHRKRSAPVLAWRSHHYNPAIPGDILIADKRNHRLLIVTPGKRIVWQFPTPGTAPNRRFAFPDDAFFGPRFDEIITNEEDRQIISIINFKQKKVVWEYGHFGVAGSAPGYLNYPDDAFLYDSKGGLITVADIRNQRILFIRRSTHQIVKQYGQTGVYSANPPATWAAPNGDFPAPHHGMLVTQIGGQDAVLLNRKGHVVWTLHFPYAYPSDANFTPHGNVICAFYNPHGAIVKMSPSGKILWQYDPTSGPGALNQPSLAMELPNGYILATDDHNDRVIVINPKTKKIIWQYGHKGVPGKAPGYLNVPDGADFLPAGITPGGVNPLGHTLWSYPGTGG